MKALSAQQAAKLLGISVEDLKTLEKQGLLHPIASGEKSFYSQKEIDQIISNRGRTISDEASLVGGQMQREMASSISFVQKALFVSGSGILGYLVLVVVFAILFVINPLQTATWLGIAKSKGAISLTQGNKDSRVLAAETNTQENQSSPIQAFLQPVGRASLGMVKSISPGSYAQVAQVAILDPNDVLSVGQNGAIIPQRPISIPESSLLQVGSDQLIANLNSEYVGGRQPGKNVGDIAIVGETPASILPEAAVITDTTISGLTNTNLSGSAAISNANLANSSVAVNTSGPLSGGGAVSLGGTLTLSCPTCVVSGSTFTPSSTNILTNKTIDAASNTLSGLTAANLTAGDFSSKITSGTYSIDITGSVTTSSNFTGSLSGDVSGTQGATVVGKINGAVLGTTTATSGNLLIGSGASWVTQPISGDATINSSGVLSLSSVGTAGVYGSALIIPVFTTDAQGRVSGVTNTTISGLTNANLANSAITTAGNSGSGSVSLGGGLTFTGSGITNIVSSASTLTVTSTEADTLATVTGRGALTSTALTLNGGITTTTSTALTLDSGTTGGISIGTGASAKTITLGNTTGATTVNINSGTGNINFQPAGSGTTGNVHVGAGGAGSSTPDLFVLDIKNTAGDPTGTNGALYYNANTSKFRCFENSAWTNCIGSGGGGSDVQSAATYKANDTLVNVGAAQVTLASVSVTPSSATGDVYVRAKAQILSSNNTDQSLVLSIEDDATCTGATLETTTLAITVAGGTIVGDFEIADVEVDAGTSSQSYSLCASTATGDSDIRLYEMFATVIDTGADLAEVYTTSDTTLEPGDVVSYDSDLKTGMKKSETPYDQNVLGIVSTRPGLIIGSVDKEGINAMPVALSGRVPVKVSAHNGQIKAGDYLTSSSIPGVAMKATKGGAIIGSAMSSFDGQGLGEVLVFVKNGSSMGSSDVLIQFLNQESSLPSDPVASNSAQGVDAESPIETTLLDYITKAVYDLFKNTIEFFGSVIFHSDVSFFGHTSFNKDTAGHAQVKAGESEVRVIFEKEYAQSPVVTVSVNLEGSQKADEIPPYAVYDASASGFTIRLSRNAPFDLTFSWIALAVLGENRAITPITDPLPVQQATPQPSATPSATSTFTTEPVLEPTPSSASSSASTP